MAARQRIEEMAEKSVERTTVLSPFATSLGSLVFNHLRQEDAFRKLGETGLLWNLIAPLLRRCESAWFLFQSGTDEKSPGQLVVGVD